MRILDWILPTVVTIATVIWAAPTSFASVGNLQHYWQSAFALATFVSIPGSVVFSVAAARRGSTARPAMALIRQSRRPVLAVYIRDLTGPFIAFTASYWIVILALTPRVGTASDIVPGEYALLVPAIAASSLSFGYLSGLLLPKIFALVMAALVPFVWVGFTLASEFAALHYATGVLFADCCRINRTIDTRYLMLSIALNASFAVLFAALALMYLLPSSAFRLAAPASAVSSSLVLFVSLTAIGSFASPTGRTVYRPAKELSCTGSSPTICLFAHQDESGDATKVLRDSWRTIKGLDIELPSRIVGALPDGHAVGVEIAASSTAAQVAYSFVAGAIGSPAICEESPSQMQSRDASYRLVQNLYLEEIETKFAQVSAWKLPLTTSELVALASLKSLPVADQRAWIQTNLKTVRTCEVASGTY